MSENPRVPICDMDKEMYTPPLRKVPDFNALAVEAMALADQFDTVKQWVADTIATAYRLGRDDKGG